MIAPQWSHSVKSGVTWHGRRVPSWAVLPQWSRSVKSGVTVLAAAETHVDVGAAMEPLGEERSDSLRLVCWHGTQRAAMEPLGEERSDDVAAGCYAFRGISRNGAAR